MKVERNEDCREIRGFRGRILHVHNVAGVSSNLALFQRKLGFEAKVITRILSSVENVIGTSVLPNF